MILKVIAVIVLVVIAGFAVVSYTELSPISPTIYTGSLTTESVPGLLFDREMTIYPAKVGVVTSNGDEIGFSSDTGIIDFGLVPQGGVGNKFISIANPRKTTIDVQVMVNGLDNVKADSSSFVLVPGENRTVTLSANISETTAIGNYTGSIGIFVVIPKYDFLSAVFAQTGSNAFGK